MVVLGRGRNEMAASAVHLIKMLLCSHINN